MKTGNVIFPREKPIWHLPVIQLWRWLGSGSFIIVLLLFTRKTKFKGLFLNESNALWDNVHIVTEIPCEAEYLNWDWISRYHEVCNKKTIPCTTLHLWVHTQCIQCLHCSYYFCKKMAQEARESVFLNNMLIKLFLDFSNLVFSVFFLLQKIRI
jgi:hypothetical protein